MTNCLEKMLGQGTDYLLRERKILEEGKAILIATMDTRPHL